MDEGLGWWVESNSIMGIVGGAKTALPPTPGRLARPGVAWIFQQEASRDSLAPGLARRIPRSTRRADAKQLMNCGL